MTFPYRKDFMALPEVARSGDQRQVPPTVKVSKARVGPTGDKSDESGKGRTLGSVRQLGLELEARATTVVRVWRTVGAAVPAVSSRGFSAPCPVRGKGW